MFDVIFVFAAVAAVVVPFALFLSFCEWAYEEHRVPFFVKWYLDWNRKEGIRRIEKVKAQF